MAQQGPDVAQVLRKFVKRKHKGRRSRPCLVTSLGPLLDCPLSPSYRPCYPSVREETQKER